MIWTWKEGSRSLEMDGIQEVLTTAFSRWQLFTDLEIDPILRIEIRCLPDGEFTDREQKTLN